MTTIQKLFVLSFFAFLAVFNPSTADAAAYIKFEGIEGESYALQRVEAPPADGKHLIATHKRSGGKVMMTARGGKIQRIFVQSASGKIKTLEATTAGCSQGGLCTTFQIKKCFTLPSGDCFCVCGSWFADNSNSNTSTSTKPTRNSKVSIGSLKDGVNVVAQTKEHILLAAIVKEGKLVGMGSIDRGGNFNRFTPDTPCSGYIVQPCPDGSAPGSYYDNEGKCVAYCDGFIVLDPSIFQAIKVYSLRPNGPCSDWIVQPCGKGYTLVSWYDYNTGKCVAICEPN